jgi:hypothetical protein
MISDHRTTTTIVFKVLNAPRSQNKHKFDIYICSDNEESDDFNLQIQHLIGVALRCEDISTRPYSTMHRAGRDQGRNDRVHSQ